jgi:hypothetical protein
MSSAENELHETSTVHDQRSLNAAPVQASRDAISPNVRKIHGFSVR